MSSYLGGVSNYFELPRQEIVWRPGDPAPGLGVALSWDVAIAAARAMAPATIVCDSTHGSLEIPSGVWDLTEIALRAPRGKFNTVTLLDGVKLPGMSLVTSLVLSSVSLGPIIDVPAAGSPMMTLAMESAIQSSVSPFVSVPAGAATFIVLVDLLSYISNNGSPAIACAAEESVIIFASTLALIEPDVLSGLGSFYVYNITGAGSAAAISHTQPDAADVSYD
jgi:hypothetical protein